MNVLIFDCPSGISGDMTVGALLDAGVPFAWLTRELGKLPVHGYRLSARRVRKGEFMATQFSVHVAHDHGHHHHRAYRDIRKMIAASRLSPAVKRRALAFFHQLAVVEARLHGTTPARVAFHELGAVDSIVDFVGAALGLERLGVEKCFVRSLALGRGISRGHHGIFPVPAPATLELLKGFRVDARSPEHELVTPTGATFLSVLCDPSDELPALELERVGYGAGQADLADRSNVLRVSVGRAWAPFANDRIVCLESNLDDVRPLEFEPLAQKLFKAGALDVFLTPILMKKFRPAVKLTVLARVPDRTRLAETLFRECPTLGVRCQEVDRLIMGRKMERVRTRYGPVRVKVGFLDGFVRAGVPEYEDCKRLSERWSVPFLRIYQAARDRSSRPRARDGLGMGIDRGGVGG